MDVVFLHLSDFHCRSLEEVQSVDISKIVESLQVLYPFDKCVIVFSGDLTNSGNENEVRIVRSFIKDLSRDIKQKYKLDSYTDTILVPGNHDLDFSKVNRDSDDITVIKKNFNDNFRQYEQIYKADIKGFDPFMKMARYLGCYREDDYIVNHRLLKYFGIKIDMCLLNTAPLSLKKGLGEDMKYHHLTSKNIEDLTPNLDADIRILVMHHPLEWFNWSVKKSLKEIINKYYDVVFVGHEHIYSSTVKNINNESQVVYLEASSLLDNGMPQGYSVAKLDASSLKFTEYKFKWNGKFYEQGNDFDVDTTISHRRTSNPSFNINKEYLSVLTRETSENLKVNLLEYFVFPVLTYHPNNEMEKDKSIKEMKQFIDLILQEKRVLVQGDSNSGKTSLCNLSCVKLAELMVPIIIRGQQVAKGAKFDNVIKQSFFEMYGFDTTSFMEYEQLGKDKKVVLIDNVNTWSMSSRDQVLSYLSNKYEYIIMFSDKEFDLDIIRQTINTLRDRDFLKLMIEPFYYVKREELINKVLTVIDGIADKKDILTVNEFVHVQSKYCPRQPEFIIQLTKYYKDRGCNFTEDKQNVFSIVFENNLYNRIREYANSANVIEIITGLEEIAYYMHFEQKYPMTYRQMGEVIDNYNKTCDEVVSPKMIHDVAVNAKIFREMDDQNSFIFREQRIFSYFVARSLVRNKRGQDALKDINYILENMCVGINGDIMLFLAYITKDIEILNCILMCGKEHAAKWTKFNLDDGEGRLEYLKFINVKERFTLPDNKEKENEKRQKGDVERRSEPGDSSNVPEIYKSEDIDTDNDLYKILKALRLLELIAKMLPNFSGTFISAEFKKSCVDLIYDYPNKIIYKLFGDINDNIEDYLMQIKKEIPELQENVGGDDETIIKELAENTFYMILSIYYYAARLAATGKTLRILDKHEKKMTTSALQNLFMHIHNGSFNDFYELAMKISKDRASDKVIEKMLRLIVRHYLFYNEVSLHGDGMRLISYFFGENAIKRIEMDLIKNRIVKKD